MTLVQLEALRAPVVLGCESLFGCGEGEMEPFQSGIHCALRHLVEEL